MRHAGVCRCARSRSAAVADENCSRNSGRSFKEQIVFLVVSGANDAIGAAPDRLFGGMGGCVLTRAGRIDPKLSPVPLNPQAFAVDNDSLFFVDDRFLYPKDQHTGAVVRLREMASNGDLITPLAVDNEWIYWAAPVQKPVEEIRRMPKRGGRIGSS
jgi:hypothetical protein